MIRIPRFSDFNIFFADLKPLLLRCYGFETIQVLYNPNVEPSKVLIKYK